MCPIRIEMGDKSNNMQNCHFFFLLARKFAGLLQTEPFYSCKFAPDNPIYHIAKEQCNLANFSLHWSDYFGKLWQIYSRRSEHSILKCKDFVLTNLFFFSVVTCCCELQLLLERSLKDICWIGFINCLIFDIFSCLISLFRPFSL